MVFRSVVVKPYFESKSQDTNKPQAKEIQQNNLLDTKQTTPDKKTIVCCRPSRLYKLLTKYTDIINA
jgi:hypothetical protein